MKKILYINYLQYIYLFSLKIPSYFNLDYPKTKNFYFIK